MTHNPSAIDPYVATKLGGYNNMQDLRATKKWHNFGAPTITDAAANGYFCKDTAKHYETKDCNVYQPGEPNLRKQKKAKLGRNCLLSIACRFIAQKLDKMDNLSGADIEKSQEWYDKCENQQNFAQAVAAGSPEGYECTCGGWGIGCAHCTQKNGQQVNKYDNIKNEFPTKINQIRQMIEAEEEH